MRDNKIRKCGLIMPISSIDGCPTEHWAEVKEIIVDSIKSINEYEFSVNLVSDDNAVGVIQKRIVLNLYHSDIVVCDVSGKNPNVMFELGMRLAFDKPTVIIKDDKTDYTFDIGIIEHLTYQRDLRFSNIVSFKEQLAAKVVATVEKSESDLGHSIFLKNFGNFKTSIISTDMSSVDTETLNDLQTEIRLIKTSIEYQKPRKHDVPIGMKIYHAIEGWIKKSNCSPKELQGNEAFYNYIEDKIDGKLHFSNRNGLIVAIDKQLEKILS